MEQMTHRASYPLPETWLIRVLFQRNPRDDDIITQMYCRLLLEAEKSLA